MSFRWRASSYWLLKYYFNWWKVLNAVGICTVSYTVFIGCNTVTTDGTTLCVKSRRALSARWTFQAQSPHATGMTQERPRPMTTLTRPRQMTTTTEHIAATNLLTVACGILADRKRPEIANLCHWKLCCHLDNATSLITNVSWTYFSKNLEIYGSAFSCVFMSLEYVS